MKRPIAHFFHTIDKLLICFLLTGLASFNVDADSQTLTLPELLQQVLNHYPSLHSTALQVQKARQASVQIESQLGWQFSTQFGISRDVSLFGVAVDRLNAATQLSRQLQSGDAISISATISRDDAETASLPTLPNPAISNTFELQYRKPLDQGRNNTDYHSALTQADSNLKIQQARQQQAYDQIAMQLIDIFSAMLMSQQRIKNIEQSIQRSQRLQRFIHNRIELGIAEDKDRLQTRAQLNGLEAQQQALEQARIKQSIALNRLTGKPWQTVLVLKPDPVAALTTQQTTVLEQAGLHSPALKINAAQLAANNSMIELQRDKGRSRVDMIFSLGNRSLSGDSLAGDINNNELVAGLQLEYNRPLDQRGNNALLLQAQLQRSITLQDKKRIDTDLYYDVVTLMAELKAIQTTIKAYQRSVHSQHAKLKEAEQRYRQGRITIDQVIRFENQTAGNELELALQQINFQHSHNRLALLRGSLWRSINLPSHAPVKSNE